MEGGGLCYRCAYSDAVLSGLGRLGLGCTLWVFFLFFFSSQCVLRQCLQIWSAYRACRSLPSHPLLNQGPPLPTAQPCLSVCLVTAAHGVCQLRYRPGRRARGAAEPLQSAVLPAGQRAQLPLRAGTLGHDFGSRCLRYKTSLRFPNGAFSWQCVESINSFNFGGWSTVVHVCKIPWSLLGKFSRWLKWTGINCLWECDIDEPNRLGFQKPPLDSNYIKKVILSFWESARCSSNNGALQAYASLHWYERCASRVTASEFGP